MAETRKGKVGTGWRYCQKCNYSTKGARSENCAKCGEAFPKRKARKKATPAGPAGVALEGPLTSAKPEGPTDLTLALAYARQAGGLSNAEWALQQLREMRRELGELAD